MSSNISKIIITLLLLGSIGFGAYYFYFSDGSMPISINLFSIPDESSPVGGDLLVLADRISMTKIDPEIFSTPLFRNLRDFSAVLLSEAQSRPNPFSPIGVDNASIAIPPNIRTPGGASEANNI